MKTKEAPRILIVDDDSQHRSMLRLLLTEWGYRTIEAGDGEQALTLLQQKAIDLILMDVRMPRMNGIDATRAARAFNPDLPILVISAHSSIGDAVKAMKAGAFDYLVKPLDVEALKLLIERSLAHIRLRSENERLRQQLARLQIPGMVGHSEAMQRVLEITAMVAPLDTTVLITGESGTGKNLVARAIHHNSRRADRPLVEVNCAAIPETLMESELFGHERGAFTGADRARPGRFAQADGGTIFLDEIGELPLGMQAKLLRALQDGEVQRVGSAQTAPVDVRVVAATNHDLEAMQASGEFRQDLYYRLNVVALEIPPLRQRMEDIPILAQHFCQRFSTRFGKPVQGVSSRAMETLMSYDWPGNVRELENAMERAIIMMQGDFIGVEDLPDVMINREPPVKDTPLEPQPGEFTVPTHLSLAEVENLYVHRVLAETGGNKSEAARRLGIRRRTLRSKLQKSAEEGPDGGRPDRLDSQPPRL